MDVSEVHRKKVPPAIFVIEPGNVIDVSKEQSAKAEFPIVFSESGSVMDVSEEHEEKPSRAIFVSESGSAIDVSEEHSEKASRSIVFTESGSAIDVSIEQPLKADLATAVGTWPISSFTRCRTCSRKQDLFAVLPPAAQQQSRNMRKLSRRPSGTVTEQIVSRSTSSGNLTRPSSSTVASRCIFDVSFVDAGKAAWVEKLFRKLSVMMEMMEAFRGFRKTKKLPWAEWGIPPISNFI
jgi:hypothetical protein